MDGNDCVPGDGKTAECNMSAIGNAAHDILGGLDFLSHDRCLTLDLPFFPEAPIHGKSY
jgi:hypothetical protein